jgi:hypothetical protein
MLIHCCRGVFSAPLRSNERGADDRKHWSSIFARVRFRGNVFAEPFLSNELFRLSGVMSQYNTFKFHAYKKTITKELCTFTDFFYSRYFMTSILNLVKELLILYVLSKQM